MVAVRFSKACILAGVLAAVMNREAPLFKFNVVVRG
jgi:hypothetical protein